MPCSGAVLTNIGLLRKTAYMGFLSKLLTMGEGKQLKRYQSIVDTINGLEASNRKPTPSCARSPTPCASARLRAKIRPPFSPRRSPRCARRRCARRGCATSTCSSSVAWL